MRKNYKNPRGIRGIFDIIEVNSLTIKGKTMPKQCQMSAKNAKTIWHPFYINGTRGTLMAQILRGFCTDLQAVKCKNAMNANNATGVNKK